MSTQNQISVTIPEETITTIMENLQECRTLLAPYLQALTAEESKSLLKMGDRTVATVLKTKEYLETNPEFIPTYMDKVEFLKDAAVVNQLNPVTNLANQLASDIDDTMMLAGSEALQAALLYYGQVKEASSKGILSAQPIYADLKQQYAKRNKKASNNTPA